MIVGLPLIDVKPSLSSAIVVSGPPAPRRILSSRFSVAGSNSDAGNDTVPKLLIAGHWLRKSVSLPSAIVLYE